ncbi:MAG: AraC family transcriptional regulator [Anaerolineae bacterium]
MSTQQRPTLEEWYALPFVDMKASSFPLGWTSIAAHHVLLKSNPDTADGPSDGADTIILALKGSTSVKGRVSSLGMQTAKVVPGSLMIVPRGVEVDGQWASEVETCLLHLSPLIIDSLIGNFSRADPQSLAIRPAFAIHDPLLFQLGNMVDVELQSQSLWGNLFIESVANMIAWHLLRNYSNVSLLSEQVKGQLSTLQIRRLNEYIEAHIAEKISLSDLAQALSISVPHLERLFRATFHRSVYAYVLEQRIERAKHLLTTSYLTITEVAHNCGFANQSHFTRHFTRSAGISPAHYRRSSLL